MYNFQGDNWTYLLCLWLVAYVYSLAGMTKFTPKPAQWPENFKRWRLPKGLVYVVGVLEFIGAFAILFPSIQQGVALLLMLIMASALLVLIIHREPWKFWTIPLTMLAVLSSILVQAPYLLF